MGQTETARRQATAVCPGCGAAFVCGMQAGHDCWCAVLPPLTFPPDPGRGCLCPDCLRRLAGDGPFSAAATAPEA